MKRITNYIIEKLNFNNVINNNGDYIFVFSIDNKMKCKCFDTYEAVIDFVDKNNIKTVENRKDIHYKNLVYDLYLNKGTYTVDDKFLQDYCSIAGIEFDEFLKKNNIETLTDKFEDFLNSK